MRKTVTLIDTPDKIQEAQQILIARHDVNLTGSELDQMVLVRLFDSPNAISCNITSKMYLNLY